MPDIARHWGCGPRTADLLVVLPTIGKNWPLAKRALDAAERCSDPGPEAGIDLLVVMDEPPADPSWRDELLLYNEHPTRRGLVHAYNVGFEYARAHENYRFLHLLEDGVIATPGYLFRMRRTLEAHPEFGWVACGQVENPKAPFTSLCSLMSRDCFMATKGLDPMFAPEQFDDGDLFLRCTVEGFRPHAIVNQVSHPQARTSRLGTEAEDWARVLDHREKFRARWNIADMLWDRVPKHAPCAGCQ